MARSKCARGFPYPQFVGVAISCASSTSAVSPNHSSTGFWADEVLSGSEPVQSNLPYNAERSPLAGPVLLGAPNPRDGDYTLMWIDSGVRPRSLARATSSAGARCHPCSHRFPTPMNISLASMRRGSFNNSTPFASNSATNSASLKRFWVGCFRKVR